MNSFVTVDEVANAQRKELEALYPIMNKEKSPDESFKSMIENVFEKKVISSVYLTGEGFEKNWYPNSLRVLCNGRRALWEIIFTAREPVINLSGNVSQMMTDRFI